MQAPIAQVIALTIYGNSIVQGRFKNTEEFFPSNSTFAFCEYMRFVDLNGDKENIYAENPILWFTKLKEEGVFAFRLIYGPSGNQSVSDRISVGFVGGGGRWLIEAISPKGSDFWEARWEVGDQNRPDKLIWQVTYRRIASREKTIIQEGAESSTLKAELSENLKEISKFARQHGLNGFADAFDKGYAALHSLKPDSGLYHIDISPDKFLDLEAAQLLAASQTAWVFGGMGSWNDLGFDGEDQMEYDRLSDKLFRLLNESCLIAANSRVRINQNTIDKEG